MPTPKGYLINQELKDAIQDVIKRDRESRGGKPVQYDDSMDREEWLSPELYVARTPVGGIPALTGAGVNTHSATGTGETAEIDIGSRDNPGVAICDIFKRGIGEDGSLLMLECGFSVEVVNLFDKIPGNDWAVVARDKFGTWYVIAAMTEGEDIPPDVPPVLCTLIEVPYKICLEYSPSGFGTGTGTGGPQYQLVTEYRTLDLSKACDDPLHVVSSRCVTDDVNCCLPDPPGTGTGTPDKPPPPDYTNASFCCEEWPDSINVIFGSSNCECFYGLSVTLTRSPDIMTADVWLGEVTICGVTSIVGFWCTGLTYVEGEFTYIVHWQLAASGCEFVLNWDETYDALTDPQPFNCGFGSAFFDGSIPFTASCCEGDVTVTSITISPA